MSQVSLDGTAAPVLQAVRAQAAAELRMSLRRGESVLVTIFIPALLLVFGMTMRLGSISFLLPGILAAAVMSTGMVSLGIATAYERYYGVLKRLGSSPLPRWGLILAKLLSVLAVEVLQVALLVALGAVVYGWRPQGSLLVAGLVLLLGTATFAGLGMLMAGALRAEATLAGANGLYLLFLLIGGVVVPVSSLGWLAGPAGLLPPAALSETLRGVLAQGTFPAGSALLLLVWAVVILAAAALTFRWE